MLSWKKDKKTDQFNVFGPAAEMKVGEYCTVTKKDGRSSSVLIQGMSRTFDIEGVPHAYGYLEPKIKTTYNQEREEPF